MKQILLTIVFLPLFIVALFAQQDVSIRASGSATNKFTFECIQGDTIKYNDPDCHFCPPDQITIFWGLKVTSPAGRKKYIRHPYTIDTLAGNYYFNIYYDTDSSLFLDIRRTNFANRAVMLDSLTGCPPPPPDTAISKVVIDTFRIVQDILEISLNSEDSVHKVNLSVYRDSAKASGIAIFREYFANVTDTVVSISVNGGLFPDSTQNICVFLEGIKLKEGGYPIGDYRIVGNQVRFNFPLDLEDVEILFAVTTGPIKIFRQYFPDGTGNSFSVTENGGTLPILRQATLVFVEGLKQIEGTAGDYTLAGNVVNFSYQLDGEDVEVLFIIGTNDLGTLGLFLNNN